MNTECTTEAHQIEAAATTGAAGETVGSTRTPQDPRPHRRTTRAHRQVRHPEPPRGADPVRHRGAAHRRDPDTPFTNTRAERDIRMVTVRQTVSGCVRTPCHAEAHCRISSSLQSMAHQGPNPLTAIQIALNGTAATMIKQEKGGE